MSIACNESILRNLDRLITYRQSQHDVSSSSGDDIYISGEIDRFIEIRDMVLHKLSQHDYLSIDKLFNVPTDCVSTFSLQCLNTMAKRNEINCADLRYITLSYDSRRKT